MDVITKQRLRQKRGQLRKHTARMSTLEIDWDNLAQNCPHYEPAGICKKVVSKSATSIVLVPGVETTA